MTKQETNFSRGTSQQDANPMINTNHLDSRLPKTSNLKPDGNASNQNTSVIDEEVAVINGPQLP